jgi:hypothetical protein
MDPSDLDGIHNTNRLSSNKYRYVK